MLDRNQVREILHNKAIELDLDTSTADAVMGIGKEIKILANLLKENMNELQYGDLILAIRTNSPNLNKGE